MSERRTPIYQQRVYLVGQVPGISGFQRWNEREYRLMRGGISIWRANTDGTVQWIADVTP